MTPTMPDLAARGTMLDALDAWERAAIEHGRALERNRGTALSLERVRLAKRTAVTAVYVAFGWQEPD